MMGGSVLVAPPTSQWSLTSVNQARRNQPQNDALHQHVKSFEGKDKITDKRVGVFKNQPSNSNDQSNLDQIPTRYKHVITSTYNSKLKAILIQFMDQLKQKPGNFSLRYQLAQHYLLLAEACRTSASLLPVDSEGRKVFEQQENTFLGKAKKENENARTIDTFNALYYYTESMIMEYEGVDCKDIKRVEKYIQLLITASALAPESTEIKQKLDTIVNFLSTRWEQLEDEGSIDTATCMVMVLQLQRWLHDDALKVLFINNPSLFQKASEGKYSAFFEQHPELKSFKAFERKYPDAGTIHLIDDLSAESISKTLALVEDHPLATKLPLINESSILTSEVADQIKAGMLKYLEKNKVLKVYLGNTEDVAVLAQAFKKSKGQGTLCEEILEMDKYSYPIYAVYINISQPFTKI